MNEKYPTSTLAASNSPGDDLFAAAVYLAQGNRGLKRASRLLHGSQKLQAESLAASLTDTIAAIERLVATELETVGLR